MMLTGFDMALGAVVVLGVLVFFFALAVAVLTKKRSPQIDLNLETPPAPAKTAHRQNPLVGAGTR